MRELRHVGLVEERGKGELGDQEVRVRKGLQSKYARSVKDCRDWYLLALQVEGEVGGLRC